MNTTPQLATSPVRCVWVYLLPNRFVIATLLGTAPPTPALVGPSVFVLPVDVLPGDASLANLGLLVRLAIQGRPNEQLVQPTSDTHSGTENPIVQAAGLDSWYALNCSALAVQVVSTDDGLEVRPSWAARGWDRQDYFMPFVEGSILLRATATDEEVGQAVVTVGQRCRAWAGG